MSEPAQVSAIDPLELDAFTSKLVIALKTVYDADNKDVTVDMTLTAPNCPVAGEMPGMVKAALQLVEGIGEVTVNMTFDPPWTPERMSEEAKLELNMF